MRSVAALLVSCSVAAKKGALMAQAHVCTRDCRCRTVFGNLYVCVGFGVEHLCDRCVYARSLARLLQISFCLLTPSDIALQGRAGCDGRSATAVRNAHSAGGRSLLPCRWRARKSCRRREVARPRRPWTVRLLRGSLRASLRQTARRRWRSRVSAQEHRTRAWRVPGSQCLQNARGWRRACLCSILQLA